ncbi:MAG: NUDIX hydrolase [Cyclobacteriaceae bacterium]|nr:NUDIX hydrolase [Cyclobacteriaceae bacterium]
MAFTYEYPRPAVTTDCIIIRGKDPMEVLLIERKHDPFMGSWALPGGFVDMDEDLEHGAIRELHEETNLTGVALQQFRTYGKPGRDPRGRTVSVVYYGFHDNHQKAMAGDDAAKVRWFDVNSLPPLAFDHAEILDDFFGVMDFKFS